MFVSPSRSVLVLAIAAAPLLFPHKSAAFEPTGNVVADHLLRTIDAGDAKVTGYDGVSETGGIVTITGLEARMDDAGEESRLRIDTTEIENGVVGDDGALTAASMRMRNVVIDEEDDDDVSVAVAAIEITDPVLPAPESVSNLSGNEVIAPAYSRAELNEIVIEAEDTGRIPIARALVTIDQMDGDMPTAGSLRVEEIRVNADALDDDERDALSDLGYESLTLTAEVSGNWDPESGSLSIDNITLSGDDAGTLNASLKINGVTRALVTQLDAAQNNPQQAMGLMQGLLVEEVTVRLDNDTLVERVLDMQATEAGVTRETFVTQLTGALPMMLAILNNAEFQNEVAGAASVFLNDPKSLQVTAMPGTPIPFASILGAAMMAPQSLPALLGVSVVAND